MATFMEAQFILALKKAVAERTDQDLNMIYAHLHGMEALSNLREAALKTICKSVRYEFHDPNDILYCRGELCTCWYILLSGSVFIDGSMFLPRSSFGKRTAGCVRRPNECLILEPSEMIVIDYPDVQLMKPGQRYSSSTMNNIDKLLALDQEEVRLARARYLSDPTQEVSLPPELQNVQTVLQRSENFLRGEQYIKRNSRASDTSSAYSGSDMMQSSVDDQEGVDIAGLPETMVDSDDEEGYVESSEIRDDESLIVRDTVRECLEKDPADRSEDDIEVLLDFMQHLPAFANMTLATRRALCAVMVFAVVEKAQTVVMNDGEELDSWSVILNGHVEIERPDGTIEHLHMGDSFGITPTMEKLYHKGVMRTKVDDCQFVCIAQSDYYGILHEGEENTHRQEENGQVVLVTEHRVLDGGNREGNIVIRGTPEHLMWHLVEDHSAVDPTYVEDFLLTYRTFLKSPLEVADKLHSWFNDSTIRDKVTRVVLLWVNNHFNDVESNPAMNEFLEKFELLLEREKMGGQLRLLNIACAAKAKPRTVVLTRATREEILHFSVLGGIERNCGIFISKVEKASKAHDAGLKRGDQILEVNNHNFEQISHNKALEILRGTTHLSITVKSNLLGFKEMLLTPDNSPARTPKKEHIARLQTDPKQRIGGADGDLGMPPVPPVVISHKDKDSKGSKLFMSTGQRNKIRKALAKMNFIPRNVSSDPQLNNLDDSSSGGGYSRVRKGSSSSTNSSPIHTPNLSSSNPDLSSAGLYAEGTRADYPEHVIKVYKADQTCKYFLIHRETSAREVVMLALREFGITDPSNQYSLCEVSVETEGFIKQKRLPDQMTGLPDRIHMSGRYYIKNNMSTEPLVPDEMMGDLLKDSAVSFLQLNSAEVAAQLTLRDFQYFHLIEPTEYMDDLFELESNFGDDNLQRFSELVNEEMFWVVTEVCAETIPVKRMKIIKQFIKIARHCKECKNFNSMFAIISGLGHGSVSRLRSSWEKLPTKYTKVFEDLQDLMDPSRNMSKYRNLINSEHVQPPMIPFFPVVKKDLTFIHLGNDSKVDGLINFEKLRMIAKEVRHICNMASAQYDLANMLQGGGNSQSVFSAFSGMNSSTVATLRRKRRSSTLPNPKKMYDEAQMVRRVRAYLGMLVVINDEMKLNEMSLGCEPPPIRKRDPSPSPIATGPKFGAEEPEAVRKLMSLSEKVKPHNSKLHPIPAHHITVPSLHSPGVVRRPMSPRQARPPTAVHLTAESSSVVSLGNIAALRKSQTPSTSESVGSNDSASPTNSIGSYQQQYETDSGHNSIASSNYDSHSTSSVGSNANSPPPQKRNQPPPVPVPPPPYNIPSQTSLNPTSRPPLPPYHVVVGNTAAYSQFLMQQYAGGGAGGGGGAGAGRRPPLPDYHAATQMAHLARRNKLQQPGGQHHQPLPSQHHHVHQMTSLSQQLELAGLHGYYNGAPQAEQEADEEYDDDNDIITQGEYDDEDEQVSAV